jgi:CRP-like cAMP-binding protein
MSSFDPKDRARLMMSDVRTVADQNRSWIVYRKDARGDGTMQPAAIAERHDPAAAHPIAELLACPPAIGNLLNASAECIEFDAGDVIFHQNDLCQGLYIVITGQLQRKAARLDSRLTLGTVRAGEVVELAAMLGDVRHTYTLVAQTRGTIMRLPKDALGRAFQSYSPLRMQLLEELAREVSRAYGMCCTTRMAGLRRRSIGSGLV